jgi:hypothetical protein
MVVDVLVRPLRWVARAATGLVLAAAVILGAGPAAPASASAPACASASADVAVADESLAVAPARAARAQAAVDNGVAAPVTRPGDRVAVDRWQRPAPGQRGPPSGE